MGPSHVLCLQDEVGRRLETAHGELVLDVEQGTIFSVSQYRGQPGLGYFCLEAEKAKLYHRGMRGGGFQEGLGPGWRGRPASLAGGSPGASPAAVADRLLPSRLEPPSFAPPAQLEIGRAHV